jgi:hypothetical protein
MATIMIDHYKVDYLAADGCTAILEPMPLDKGEAMKRARCRSIVHGRAAVIAYSPTGPHFEAVGAINFMDGRVSDEDGIV